MPDHPAADCRNALEPGPAEGCPIDVLTPEMLEQWRSRRSTAELAWLDANGFRARPAQCCLLPGTHGAARVAVGCDPVEPLWSLGDCGRTLPGGLYCLEERPEGISANDLALGWALGQYRFDGYRTPAEDGPEPLRRLRVQEGTTDPKLEAMLDGIVLARDLINTPAGDMMPEALAGAASHLAARHAARFEETVGEALLAQGFPAIHAVGRASSHAPRLLDLTWGPEDGPRVTLVGKGVCFDSGGLDLKSAAGMRLMKKDMGGAAHALGLAAMVMGTGLPIRLRVLVPAVENAVSGNAYRPGDVLPSRAGLSIEIENTDAEGRVVLSDALWEGGCERPELMIDFATLTGAARVALGTELPALFCNDDRLAADLLESGVANVDPICGCPCTGRTGPSSRERSVTS